MNEAIAGVMRLHVFNKHVWVCPNRFCEVRARLAGHGPLTTYVVTAHGWINDTSRCGLCGQVINWRRTEAR